MGEASVVYANDTGLDLFLYFDDEDLTAVAYAEDEYNLRRYVITDDDLIAASILKGNYFPSVRSGDMDYPDDASILAAFPFNWTGAKEVTGGSGGGMLSARIGIVSLTSENFFEIVQGEEKTVTFIVEAHGRFDQEIFNEIVVKLADSAGTVVVKDESDDSVVRVCEALDVQVIRCTLTAGETASLVAGLMQIEIAFDAQKARLTHSLLVLEQIAE